MCEVCSQRGVRAPAKFAGAAAAPLGHMRRAFLQAASLPDCSPAAAACLYQGRRPYRLLPHKKLLNPTKGAEQQYMQQYNPCEETGYTDRLCSGTCRYACLGQGGLPALSADRACRTRLVMAHQMQASESVPPARCSRSATCCCFAKSNSLCKPPQLSWPLHHLRMCKVRVLATQISPVCHILAS